MQFSQVSHLLSRCGYPGGRPPYDDISDYTVGALLAGGSMAGSWGQMMGTHRQVGCSCLHEQDGTVKYCIDDQHEKSKETAYRIRS